MRNLPEEHNREERRAAECDAAVGCGPPDERGQRARHGAHERGQGRTALERRVDREIDDERRERQPGGDQVPLCGQQREAGDRGRDSEEARIAWQHASVGERPASSAPHQRVGVALEDLIEHGSARGDERRARDGLQHRRRFGHARRPEVVAGRARGDDEEVEARFREADEIGECSAAGSREYDRGGIGANVLHVGSAPM